MEIDKINLESTAPIVNKIMNSIFGFKTKRKYGYSKRKFKPYTQKGIIYNLYDIMPFTTLFTLRTIKKSFTTK